MWFHINTNGIIHVMTFLLQHFSSFFPTLISSLLSFPIRYRIWTTAYVYFHTVFISYNHIWIYMYIYIYINLCMRLVMVSFKNGIWYIYFSPSCFFLWKAPHEIDQKFKTQKTGSKIIFYKCNDNSCSLFVYCATIFQSTFTYFVCSLLVFTDSQLWKTHSSFAYRRCIYWA